MAGASTECIATPDESSSSMNCVCNSTHCDEIKGIDDKKVNQVFTFTTSMDGLRLHRSTFYMKPAKNKLKFRQNSNLWFREPPILQVDRGITYQSIHGFGVSFTDSAGLNVKKLSRKSQEKLIESYFGKTGIELNMGRVPIGGTDFSTHSYAYNDLPEDDPHLSNFSLTRDDYRYKIPLIKLAMNHTTSQLYLIGSVWSPPPWMKTNQWYGGFSSLLPRYYQSYADYHIRFLEEYKKCGVEFWGITTGNEPIVGLITAFVNSLGWTPSEQGAWIIKHFGPTIKTSPFKNIKILSFDEMRMAADFYMNAMIKENKTVLNYIDGIATHSYFDYWTPQTLTSDLHDHFPDKYIISTETASGCLYDATSVKNEENPWGQAQDYVLKLIANFNHWMTGWIEWNLSLDARTRGPAWNGNGCDSPVVTVPEADEFHKLPLYYALGHFSKFVPRNSTRIRLTRLEGDIDSIAFLRPDGLVTIVLYNKEDEEVAVTILEEGRGYFVTTVPRFAIRTIVY